MPTPPPPVRRAYSGADRRRRPRGSWSRLLTAPIPTGVVEKPLRRALSGIGRALAPLARITAWATAVALLGIAGWWGWTSRVPVLTPRDRPESLCFVLAQERYAPPIAVEPSSSVVRGRFSSHTPAGIAVREAMGFTDDMVINEQTRATGDYEVTVLWLRLPGDPGHWLVLAWMEDADLAVASFHFHGDDPELTGDERVWGDRLMTLALAPENFRAASLPAVRLRGGAPQRFGPKTGRQP